MARKRYGCFANRERDEAGQVMMITGDNKLTAEAISRKIGLFSEGESLKGKSFTGREFSVLTPDQQRLTLEVSP